MSELLASAGQAGMRPSLRRRLFGRIPAAFAETGGSLYSLPEREQLERYADAFYGLARLFRKCRVRKNGWGMRTWSSFLRRCADLYVPDAEGKRAAGGMIISRAAGSCMRCWQIWSMTGSVAAETGSAEKTVYSSGRSGAGASGMLPAGACESDVEQPDDGAAHGGRGADLPDGGAFAEIRVRVYRPAGAGTEDPEKMKRELHGLGIELGPVRVFQSDEDRMRFICSCVPPDERACRPGRSRRCFQTAVLSRCGLHGTVRRL